jgi:hypothetical protein
MKIALGYRHFPTALGGHVERALKELGHTVTYVGLPSAGRPGYDTGVPLDQLIRSLPEYPDLYLWVDPAGRYFPNGIEDLPIPTACYLVDVHLGHWRPQVARFFDAVFIAQRDYVDAYRAATGHAQVYWLPLGAAPDVHYDHHLPRTYDVGFVGNIALAHRRTARARRLALLTSRYHTNDVYASYTPEEVGCTYSLSRIVFNTSIAGDVTMRVFEGTACGALVVTDATANGLDELFNIGKEIVTFESDDDLIRKIDYHLSHEDERATIAAAGQRRTLEQHLYTHRAQYIMEAVQSPSFERIAPMRKATPAQRLATRNDIYTHLHMLDAILDDQRAAGYGPLRRLVAALPCMARRILR